MKLATFIVSGSERFGLVVSHPHTGEDWVFEPGPTQTRLAEYAKRGTSPYVATRPVFWEGDAPGTMLAFLESGPDGMAQMRRFQDFLTGFLDKADTFILLGAGHRLADVRLRAPIPRPRLLFGLVQNSPTAWRHVPERRHLNVFPQGHQRPQGCVIDPGEPIILPYSARISGGWNPELAAVIGVGGRDIPVSRAMAHVAGLTIVSDVTVDYFRQDMFAQPEPYDWFEDAMTSWGDKKSDRRFPIGPYLVTLEEVGNPYDLMVYTRQSGYLRDRTHTGAMHIGIERTVSWLSSFRELHPGDIIHMGTMGYDGSPFSEQPFAGDVIESEIEKLGVLRNPVVHLPKPEPGPVRVSADDLPVAARELAGTPGEAIASPEAWSVDQTRHFWTVFANYAAAEAQEGLTRRPYPRFLGAPATALAASGHAVRIPGRAKTLSFGCELACVIGRIISWATPEQGQEAILGFAPMAVVRDSSFKDAVIEPASLQERHLPSVYARWADGFNIVGRLVPLADEAWRNRRCLIEVDGLGRVETSTADYLLAASEVLAYITRYITLFPGDVLSLGPLGRELVMPMDARPAPGTAGSAEIDGLGRVEFTIGQDEGASPPSH